MERLHFSEERWECVRQNTMAWWAHDLPRPLVYLAMVEPGIRRPYSYMSNYPLDTPVDYILDKYEKVLCYTHYYADAFPWLWVNFGPGIAAGFLGAAVHSVVEPSETVWFGPPKYKPIQDLHLSFDGANPWWERVKAITRGLVERFGADLAVSHTDLGGNLDILASFRETQTLLMDLIDSPDEVARLTKEISNLWIRYYDELDRIIWPTCRGTSCWTPIWSSDKTYMLQSDFSYMISPAMFEQFVAPDLETCCKYLEHGFYHLDGRGQIPHLDMLLGIERLRGIQWIPGDGQPPPDQWLPLLKRIRDGGKLCQVFVRPAGALEIVKNLGGRGFLLVIQPAEGELNSEAEIQAFLARLDQDDVGK
jgi:hypothetical protein